MNRRFARLLDADVDNVIEFSCLLRNMQWCNYGNITAETDMNADGLLYWKERLSNVTEVLSPQVSFAAKNENSDSREQDVPIADAFWCVSITYICNREITKEKLNKN